MPLPHMTCTAGMQMNAGPLALTTAGPVSTTSLAAKLEAHGRVGMDGKITFGLDDAKTVTAYIWNDFAAKWFTLPTLSAGADQQRWIDAPVKALFFLAVDATTTTAYVYTDQIG